MTGFSWYKNSVPNYFDGSALLLDIVAGDIEGDYQCQSPFTLDLSPTVQVKCCLENCTPHDYEILEDPSQVLLAQKFNIRHVCLEARKTHFEFFRAGAKSSFLA